MADISKIKLPDGSEFNIKDAAARSAAEVQSNWTEDSSAAPSYIQNRPALRAGDGEGSIVEGAVDYPPYSAQYIIYITGSGYDFTYTTEDTLPAASTIIAYGILVDGSSYREITAIDTTAHTISINFNYIAQTNREVKIWILQANVASGSQTHAEGWQTLSNGNRSHSEGLRTQAHGSYSHAEGNRTRAIGASAHAEGQETRAIGTTAHAEGKNTIANHRAQHVFGECNIEDPSTQSSAVRGNYVEIVGNGTSESSRSNARTLDWSGNETLAGKLTVGTPGVNSLDVATVGQLPTKTSDLTNDSNFQTTTNLVTTLSSESTDTQYPSAKAVYDAIAAGGGGGSSPVTYTYTDPNNDGNIIISQQVLGTLDQSQF